MFLYDNYVKRNNKNRAKEGFAVRKADFSRHAMGALRAWRPTAIGSHDCALRRIPGIIRYCIRHAKKFCKQFLPFLCILSVMCTNWTYIRLTMSVCSYVSTQEPIGEFLLNLVWASCHWNYQILVLFNFLQSVMPARWTNELLRWERHYRHLTGSNNDVC